MHKCTRTATYEAIHKKLVEIAQLTTATKAEMTQHMKIYILLKARQLSQQIQTRQQSKQKLQRQQRQNKTK